VDFAGHGDVALRMQLERRMERTSDPAVIEHRMLDLAYTTDAAITPAVLAFYTPCSIEDAEHVLDRLVTEGRLRMDIDDDGNVTYGMPGRVRLTLPRPISLAPRTSTSLVPREHEPRAAIAAVLSLVVPGAGQLYAGRPLSAFMWFAMVTVGYLFLVIPGLLLHILCVASAAAAAHHPRPTTA
jgi:hypothetical protein